MYLVTRKILFITSLFFLSPLALALTSDRQQDTIIHADHTEMQNNKHYTILTGHVRAEQGSSLMTGDKAIVYLDKKNKIIKIVDFGKPATYSTLRDNEKEPLNVSADTIEYTPETGIMVLTKNAVVTQGNDSIRAPYIKYDVKNEIMISDGIKNNKQTTIILQPQDLH